MRILTLVCAIALASSLAPIASANDTAPPAPPPAKPAPAASPDDAELLTTQLAEARRDVIASERELREANAAVARASHKTVGVSELERMAERQERAQRAFETARDRVPGLVARARAAGMSASALRSYEHSLHGD